MNTSENRRWHAAGHLAAAHILAASGYRDAASRLLQIVREWTMMANVSAPPAVLEMLFIAQERPHENIAQIALLESWFCDPFNTVIEQSGAKFI